MKTLKITTQFKKDLKRYKKSAYSYQLWRDKESDIIKLVRFGTHSELF